ncbi:MAG: tetratricopeptide repeat protein [Candidatus Sumerlaeia bacterium]|nr:tetratricopeptide repeat protein [Candidatus Sumerlaeia bacterium]
MDRIEQLEQFAADEPDDALTHFLLGREYMNAKRWEDAVRVLARCVELDPDYTAAVKALADSLRLAGRADDAAIAYRQGIATAERTGDLQVKKECQAFLNRLEGA